MGIFLVQVVGLVINVCTFASVFVIQGSAGTSLQPPLIPPLISALAPQMTILPSSTPPASAPSIPPPYLVAPPPTSIGSTAPAMAPIPLPTNPQPSASAPFTPEAPAAPFTSPPIAPATQPSAPVSMPPNSHQNKTSIINPPLSPIAPVLNVPPSRRMPLSPGPSQSVIPKEPPPLPPVASTPPASPRKFPPPYIPLLPKEPPLSPPEQNASPILTPPPRISPEVPALPLPAPVNKTANNHAPVSHSPSKASKPSRYSPKEHHHARNYTNSPPLLRIGPPPRSKQAPPRHTKSDPKVNLRHEAPPPTIAGSVHPSRIISPFHSDNHYSPSPAPAPAPSGQNKILTDSPELPPSRSLPRIPKPLALPPPFLVLPPPPPQKDCGPLTCSDPLTYGLPESPCICVFPIQVGLRVNIALYTFFPLVSELAAEIAAGVFMKQSQVRIMGANAASDNPEKTVVLIDLIPIGEKFNDMTAYLTFQRLWLKQVLIKDSVFGDYDVLYVRYPGLPPSPPLPPSTLGVIGSKPYPGHGNNAGALKPLGVDAGRNNQHRDGPSGSILATIIFSAFVAAILLCVIAWVLLFKHKDCAKHQDQTPANTIPSLTKASGRAISMLGSGPSSPSFSLGGSNITAYTGSAKTFSTSDIERATDFFNETRILGEGGFGRVYRGVFEDGTKVAMKVLKRCDQQGGREFLAEVEMLSRLHHRNLVKLIGICTEERTRCLVYELIPNGSVESHLHGIDKETVPLDWRARLKIALGAARALAYLHEDSSPPVIHRDFKASNILLEDDFTPKVSDFGLARTAFDEKNKHISTRVMGTFGYVAPEYAMTGHLLVKSDVYSYGVVLLELLTGKKPIDMSQPPGQENLVAWARPLLTSQEGLESLTDPVLGPDFPFDSIAKVAAIASMCVQPEVSHRPFMGEVVQALKLVCNECDEINKESQSRSFVHDNLPVMPDRLLSPSPVCNYDYRVDVERVVSMSELLSPSVKFGERDDCESFRRHSSSGPLRMGKSKQIWKMMGRLSRGSVSEHGAMFRLWPGSH